MTLNKQKYKGVEKSLPNINIDEVDMIYVTKTDTLAFQESSPMFLFAYQNNIYIGICHLFKLSLFSDLKTYSDETRKKISDSKIGIKRDSSTWNKKYIPNKVYEYNKLGKFIKEWNSIKEVSTYYNINLSSLTSNLHMGFYNKGLFLLSKEKFDNVEPYKKVNSKKIEQYTKEGIFIREWDSLNDAKDYFNLKSSSISNALTGRSSTANGFIWKYKL